MLFISFYDPLNYYVLEALEAIRGCTFARYFSTCCLCEILACVKIKPWPSCPRKFFVSPRKCRTPHFTRLKLQHVNLAMRQNLRLLSHIDAVNWAAFSRKTPLLPRQRGRKLQRLKKLDPDFSKAFDGDPGWGWWTTSINILDLYSSRSSQVRCRDFVHDLIQFDIHSQHSYQDCWQIQIQLPQMFMSCVKTKCRSAWHFRLDAICGGTVPGINAMTLFVRGKT